MYVADMCKCHLQNSVVNRSLWIVVIIMANGYTNQLRRSLVLPHKCFHVKLHTRNGMTQETDLPVSKSQQLLYVIHICLFATFQF